MKIEWANTDSRITIDDNYETASLGEAHVTIAYEDEQEDSVSIFISKVELVRFMKKAIRVLED
jgi:hypothetical protein